MLVDAVVIEMVFVFVEEEVVVMHDGRGGADGGGEGGSGGHGGGEGSGCGGSGNTIFLTSVHFFKQKYINVIFNDNLTH